MVNNEKMDEIVLNRFISFTVNLQANDNGTVLLQNIANVFRTF
jgi:hypothetical protein